MIKKIVRRLWSLQPRFLRRLELDLLELCLTKPLDKQRQTRAGDVVVCGLLGTASGLGQGARQMVQLFQNKGLPVRGANASRFAILEDFDGGDLWPERTSDGGYLIFYINPDILSLVVNAIGRNKLNKRRVAGVWFWELEIPPKRWARGVKLVDEIWAPSQFVADAVRKIAGDKPVYVLPLMLDVDAYYEKPKEDPLPEQSGKTIVFFSYDVRSLHARKNPEALIHAFKQAAQNNKDAHLVIKVNNSATWPESLTRLKAAIGIAENITILQKKLSDQGMKDLMARADIIMSLHRSEGFGLLMAEGMAASKPVIATGWSANMDFMTPETSVLIDYTLIPIVDPQHIYDKHGARWAEPDVAQAATALKYLLENPEKRIAMGKAARTHIEYFFSKKNWFEKLPQTFWDALEK